jgi:predicted AAA+ superfamily ATPase
MATNGSVGGVARVAVEVRAPIRGYQRRVLDDELDELMASLAAIALEGAKAVGKTATAAQRVRTIHQLDDPERRAIAEADVDRLLTAPPPVLIDEWEYVPAVWDKIRRAADDYAQPGQFLLTGSASPKNTGTHSGGGRIVSLRMRPLSLAERWPGEATVSVSELLDAARPEVDGQTRRGLEDYTDEIMRSGFPGIRILEGRARRAQLDSYLHRIVDRDFEELGHQIRNPTGLRRWMSAYAAATATTTSFERIRDAASGGTDRPPAKTTVQPYREVLERLFILDELPGWQPSRNPIARLALPPKHHLADPALAATLLGATASGLLEGDSPGPAIPRDGTLLGALFESLVTQSVKVYAQAAEASVGHLRLKGGAHELDLIIDRGDGRVVAIEIKLSAIVRADSVKHLNWLQATIGDDLLDRVLITTGTEAYRRPDGIAVVPAALLGP